MKFFTSRAATLTCTAVLIFTVFAVSIPTHKAEAQRATLWAQLMQNVQLSISAVQNTLSAANTGITAANTTSLLVKENLLDGIGWAIAKQMVSNMTRSLINWINSGFEGSPSFVTDLNAFLLDALDTAAGEYIRSLGGIGEFICSPFRLDIQAALSVSYAQARSGLPSGPTAPACRLTDIANNIEGFFAGVSEGGWQDWLSVTNDPQNTPYGAYLEAQTRLKIKLVNEAGQEKEVASWGDGFLSKKICESIEGTSGGNYGQTAGSAQPNSVQRSSGNCVISTPGQVISEALTFQLSTGPRSLIEADEINELIGALLNQLVLKAMEGVNGLLGLSEGTGYTDRTLNGTSTRAYIDDMADEILIDTTTIRAQMGSSTLAERSYLTTASSTLREANSRLAPVRSAQTAMSDLFSGNNSGAELANITRSDTLSSARAQINDELDDTPTSGQRSALEATRAQLASIESSLRDVQPMFSDINRNTSLTNLSFTTLEDEANTVAGDLLTLVSELNEIVPRVRSNITLLNDMISRYDNATSTTTTSGTGTSTIITTRSVAAIRNDIAMEYASIVSGNRLTSEATAAQNRTRWQLILK